jgi:hypothetical protein
VQLADWSIGGYSVYDDVASLWGRDMQREEIGSADMFIHGLKIIEGTQYLQERTIGPKDSPSNLRSK